jgi:hypothetical protein
MCVGDGHFNGSSSDSWDLWMWAGTFCRAAASIEASPAPTDHTAACPWLSNGAVVLLNLRECVSYSTCQQLSKPNPGCTPRELWRVCSSLATPPALDVEWSHLTGLWSRQPGRCKNQSTARRAVALRSVRPVSLARTRSVCRGLSAILLAARQDTFFCSSIGERQNKSILIAKTTERTCSPVAETLTAKWRRSVVSSLASEAAQPSRSRHYLTLLGNPRQSSTILDALGISGHRAGFSRRSRPLVRWRKQETKGKVLVRIPWKNVSLQPAELRLGLDSVTSANHSTCTCLVPHLPTV